MFSIKNIAKAKTAEEAHSLARKRTNAILGGTAWLKLGNRSIQTAIDLSLLELDQIEEKSDYYQLGAMLRLADLINDQELNDYYDQAFSKAWSGIVGVQFRNVASLGGSLGQKAGFSDVYTLLLGLQADILIHNRQPMPLSDFALAPRERILITHAQIPKKKVLVAYENFRLEAGDIPICNLCLSYWPEEDQMLLSVGARPGIAQVIDLDQLMQKQLLSADRAQLLELGHEISQEFDWQSNRRGSVQYRQGIFASLLANAALDLQERKEIQ